MGKTAPSRFMLPMEVSQMSNIPAARTLLIAALNGKRRTKVELLIHIRGALALMTRVPAVTHARSKPVKITRAVRQRVQALAKLGWSQTEIARKCGLHNSGRVSEILHGKR